MGRQQRRNHALPFPSEPLGQEPVSTTGREEMKKG